MAPSSRGHTSAKHLTSLVIFLLTVISCSGSRWHYGQEDEWPEKCLIGKHQSPVNLQKHLADKRGFNPMQFANYDELYEATLTNNGHSVMLKLKIPETTSNSSWERQGPYVKGGGLPDEYILDHLHFHWASEHTIHSNRFPLELHLVHYSKKFESTVDAVMSASQQALAVVGVLYDLTGETTPGFNPHFLNALKDVEKSPSKEIPIPGTIRVIDFLPRDTSGFYRYEGSLTTPSCDESVIWTVFSDTGHIEDIPLNEFHSVHSEIGPLSENFRPLQALNGRIITLRESTARYQNGVAQTTVWCNAIILIILALFLQ